MLFNSTEFLIFFLIVFSAYWALPARWMKVILLLFASYYFYMSWNRELALVVACSSLVDYLLARRLEECAAAGRRKAILTANIVMNLGLLIYFKYVNFFLESLGELLHGVGLDSHMPVLKVVLPIGISFYTFEAISYMMDVYRKRTVAEKNPLHFLLFITFFPRMVAGPIIRAKNFLPQLNREKRFDWGRFDLGLQYVLMGLFKKLVVADRMSWLVDPVYATPGNYSTGAAWVAMVAYSLQIYCDFSGYSDIALGTAHMLGFKLPVNFDMPYVSRNIGEFWRRWHISLSTWLRDYLFIPLGGNRRSPSRAQIVMLITMTLCGLWHGARWTFVGFGTIHGLMLLTHRAFHKFCKTRRGLKAALTSAWGTGLRIATTYMSVCFASVIFRSENYHKVWGMYHALFIPQRGMMVRDPVGPWSLVFTFALLAVCHFIVETGRWKPIARSFTPLMWGVAYLLLVVSMFMLVTESTKAFIYFQF